MASSVAVSATRGACAARGRRRAGRTSSLTATAGSPPRSRCRRSPCRVRPVASGLSGRRSHSAGMLTVPCAARPGQSPGTPARPAIPAPDRHRAAPAAGRRAAPRAARWPAGSGSWRPSPSRANGASATSPARPTSRAAPPTGSSTTWPRSACSPRPTSRAGSGSARTWPGSACSSPSTSTSGASAGRSSSGPRRPSARPSSSPSTTPVRRQFSAVDAVETSHPIRYLWESLRDWSDLHLGSSGKGILAFLPPDEQAAILDRLPDPIPGRTAADQGAAPRGAGSGATSAATSSATASASRARSASRRRSATRVAGSSAT